ncbi:MAG: hypothetical protein ACLSCV_12335 [Acutalibacteraceae bacterium]
MTISVYYYLQSRLFLEMESAGILQEGASSVEIIWIQTAFLKEKRHQCNEMDEQEIREANTEDKNTKQP